MRVQYLTCSFDVAKAEGWPAPFGDSWDDWYDYDLADTTGIWRVDNDRPNECIGFDGCEPEDATLHRSYFWVVAALNNAYQVGYEEGKNE